MQVDLTPDDGIAAAMHQQLEVFDHDMFGDTQFSNRNNLIGDLLGIAGLDQLHRMDAFFWLNQQIAEQVSLYLIDLLGPNHGLEVHIQKAWPVVCSRDGGTIESHTHRNAQLSAVFYVCTEEDPGSGELEFQAPDTYFSHVMEIPFREATVSGGVFAPKQHRLLLFPSDLRHRFLPYEGVGAALFGVVRPGRHHSPRTGSRNAHAPSHGLGSNRWLVLNLRESGQQRSLHDRRV